MTVPSSEGRFVASPNSAVRNILVVIMNLLVVCAIAETVRMVVAFFGVLAAAGWGEMVLALTNPITIGFGFEAIKTPYGGVFDVNAALTVVVILVIEWALSVVRGRS